jgi:HNH endonuclease
MSADTELRNAVAERDGWLCRFCRRRLVPPPAGPNHTAAEATTIATLDHWVPRCRGGSGDLANVVIACRTCNEEKGALTGPEYLVVRAFRRLSDPASRAIPAALDERLVAAVACRTVHVLLGKSAATVAAGAERPNRSTHRPCGTDGTGPGLPLPATRSEQREFRPGTRTVPDRAAGTGTAGRCGPAPRGTDRAAVPDRPTPQRQDRQDRPGPCRQRGEAPAWHRRGLRVTRTQLLRREASQ